MRPCIWAAAGENYTPNRMIAFLLQIWILLHNFAKSFWHPRLWHLAKLAGWEQGKGFTGRRMLTEHQKINCESKELCLFGIYI